MRRFAPNSEVTCALPSSVPSVNVPVTWVTPLVIVVPAGIAIEPLKLPLASVATWPT